MDFTSLQTIINKRLTTMRFFKYFLLFGLGSLIFNSCSNQPNTPYQVKMSVDCADEEVLDLVYRYYGQDITYTIFKDDQFKLRREALMGEYQEWIDGDSLYIQDIGEDYAISTFLDGVWLESYLDEPIVETLAETDEYEDIAGVSCQKFIGLNSYNDTSWMWVAKSIPNAWITLKDLPGLPLKYQYKVRDQLVTYMTESIEPVEESYDLANWGKGTIELSPSYYLGQESDDLDLNRDVFSADVVFYHMTTNEPLEGSLQITSRDGTTEDVAEMMLNGGTARVLLRPGKFYSLLFARPGFSPKRINFNLSAQPLGLGAFSTRMDIGGFPTANLDVINYLFETPIGVGGYDAETDQIVMDSEYSEAVKEELQRIREASFKGSSNP